MAAVSNGDTEGMDCALYDPFKRKDRFGCIGTAPMRLSDRLIVILFTIFVLPLRAILSVGLLIGTYLACSLIQLLPLDLQPSWMGKVGPVFCHLCLAVFGIRVQWIDLSGDSGASDAFPCATISNHVSWLDIVVYMAHSFPSFVAAASVRQLPLVGKIRFISTRSIEIEDWPKTAR